MPRPRLVPWSVLAAALLVYSVLDLAIVFVLFPSGVLGLLARPSHGLITSTWLANVLMLVLLAAFLRRHGGLRLGDIGLSRQGVASGAAVALAAWLALNAIEAAYALHISGGATLDPQWRAPGPAPVLGALLAQVFGNAALEEAMFRGLLFRQLLLRLQARHRGHDTRALIVALLVSQACFAAIHVPLRLSAGMAPAALPGELLLLFSLGVALALVYWRTGNLYIAIGVHALSNAPTLLVRPQGDLSSSGIVAAAASLVIVVCWPRTAGVMGRAEG